MFLYISHKINNYIKITISHKINNYIMITILHKINNYIKITIIILLSMKKNVFFFIGVRKIINL